MSFLAELQRRNVLRAGVLYAGAVWALAQGLAQLLPLFGDYEWIARWFVIAAIIGFPFWIAFAWFYEFTPQGLKRESELVGDASIARSTGRALDKAIIAVLAIAVVLLLANTFVLHKETGSAPMGKAPDKSIAVLPFLDLSPNHDQGYFSDGMSEELLDALAQVKALKVAGRTSSFHFRDTRDDLATVGKALGVANVLEGSVRKQENKVRISVRLIEVANDKDLWSHDYDGDLSDVFKLQESIAKAITEQLRIVLVGEQKVRLVPELTANPEAHALYLRASAIFARRDGARFPEAISQLQQAITLDPRFARAHARLGAVLAVSSNYMPVDFDATLQQAEKEAMAALALDPQLAEAHAVLGLTHDVRRDFVGARSELEQAMAIDPGDTAALGWTGSMWLETGFSTKAAQQYDRILAIDPLSPSALAWRARIYLDTGDHANARRMYEQSMALGLSWSEARFADIKYADGNKAEAVASATRGMKAWLAEFPEGTSAILAQGMYGDDPGAHAKALAAIDGYLATKPKTLAGVAPWALLRLGEPARALELMAPAPTGNDQMFYSDLWSPFGKDARALPQFGVYLQRSGVATFWDRYGPPPGCHRNADGRYACE
ncbi:MAG TPA: tetratricopeptide repeat protein [Rudaea sp.]|nr:tetratricopeptide repeat protein [Rudaea sp.]